MHEMMENLRHGPAAETPIKHAAAENDTRATARPRTTLSRFDELPAIARWLIQIAALAAAYYLMGRLGLLLAIPPGYATAVWPPSGIALAGLLFFGYRAWPGVWVGSFLVNAGTTFDASSTASILMSLSIAASIGAGATVQAVAGAWLIRRYVGFPSALEHERDILLFMLLGGPLSCLINSSIGAGTLWLRGLIPNEAILFSWWTWWVGDAIGVLIVTPLIMIFAGRPRTAWRRRRLSVAVPLIGTFTLAVLIFIFVSGQEQRRIEAQFHQRAGALADSLRNRLTDYVQILNAVESFYASSQNVTRQEFRRFVQRKLADYPGIQALSWNPRVFHAERERYEAAARRDGISGFRFTERDEEGRLVSARSRAEYVPVYYIEPHVANESALGYNVASDPMRLETMERARESGQPAATARVHLVQERARQAGVLLFAPIFDEGAAPRASGVARKRLLGYAAGVFRLDDMVNAALQQQNRAGVILRIEDTTAEPDQRLLYGPPDESGGAAPMRWQTTVDMGGRPWRLDFSPTREYVAAQRSWAAWLVLAAGLLFTALLGAFLLIMTGRASRIEQLVAERTAELSRSNAGLEQFAYVASHDLKEPLRMIGGFTELLATRYRGKLDREAEEYMSFVLDGVRRMRHLIDDLLAYSRVARRGAAPARVDCNPLIAGILSNFRRVIEESGARLSHDPLPTVAADASQLVQLFQNLIDNALKFRGKSAPIVHISAKRSEGEWVFSVTDNGIGIESQYWDRIFVIFQRLHTRQSYPGTGIGLALAKRIVERHGGRIWLESAPGRGTTFFFTLPIHKDANR